MRWGATVLTVALLIALVWMSGCSTTSFGNQQAGNFGGSSAGNFGSTADQQAAIQWFITTYGDPRGSGTPAFIEPMVSTNVVDNMPVDKVTAFSKATDKIFFWVFYEHFTTGDTITMNMVYTTNGQTVLSSSQQTGGAYGAATGSVSPPSGGWPTGDYLITFNGKGATKTVAFKVIDGPTATVPLPYAGAASKVAQQTTAAVATPTQTKLSMNMIVHSWIRNCPEPPGGQEYYSYAYDEDTGYWIEKYDGCDGNYQEWSNIKSIYHPGDEPYKSGNQNIDDAFNIMIKASKSVVVNTNYSNSEQNKKILESAFKNAVSALSKGGDKGEFVNITVTQTNTPAQTIQGSIKQTKTTALVAVPVATETTPVTTCIPVVNATVIVKQVGSSGETQIAQSITDENGVFSFTVLPSKTQTEVTSYTFNFYITAPGYTLEEGASNKITTEVSVSDGPHYEFVLCWQKSTGKTQNRGTFAVSGRSTA